MTEAQLSYLKDACAICPSCKGYIEIHPYAFCVNPKSWDNTKEHVRFYSKPNCEAIPIASSHT